MIYKNYTREKCKIFKNRVILTKVYHLFLCKIYNIFAVFKKISCENAPNCSIKALMKKCKKACILQQKTDFNIVLLYTHSVCLIHTLSESFLFFFKTLETNICSCYTIQTELSSDIHHFLYRNEDFYL